MITAEEASKLYDENLLVRDRYISEVIEPLIKKHASKNKEITLSMRDRFYVGSSIDFSKKYSKDSVNIELTKEIIKILKENGYKTKIDCSSGTEYKDGAELLQCLAELKIDKAKKIEQEIFTNIDNAINWYYKFYPAKTDDEKDSLLTVEFKRNKTKKAIQELIKRIENKSTIEEARIILEDFNFTPPENKSKKSYIT